MKKKVLFINPSLMQGGVEHSLVTALKTLDPNKYEITLFIYQEKTDLLPEIPDYVKVIVQPDCTRYFRKPYCAFKLLQFRFCKLFGASEKAETAQKKMYAYIHRLKTEYPRKKIFCNEHFDAVVSYSLHIGTEMGLKINADKYYVLMHSSQADYHREIIESSLEQYDKIVAVSENVADVYRKNYPVLCDKIITIDNYVDAQRTIELARAQADLPLKSDADWIFATCGRISPEKGFDLAVRAAGILKNKGISFRWLFIGDGPERERIERLIREERLDNEIMITGFKNNPFPYINACDIYVHPSYEEAQPMVLLETMVLGKPIVSTKTVGGETILENGKKGVLTDFTGDALAEGILSLTGSAEKTETFSNLYSPAEDARNRQIYAEKWEALLSE